MMRFLTPLLIGTALAHAAVSQGYRPPRDDFGFRRGYSDPADTMAATFFSSMIMQLPFSHVFLAIVPVSIYFGTTSRDVGSEISLTAPIPTPSPAPVPDVVPMPDLSPLTSSEKQQMLLAVQACWNLGAVTSEALEISVTVGFSMTRDGRPDTTSITLVSATDGSDAATRQAFEAARRAIIRCGARGFDLPISKYPQWAKVEVTFNPEGMKMK